MTTAPPSCITVEEIADGSIGSFLWLAGENFSGRSGILEKVCDRFVDRPGAAILIPPEVHNAVSGLVPSVLEELLLHAGKRGRCNPFWKLADQWHLLEWHKRDPFTLSGGELAMLVILCKLSLRPQFLCLDGALEQLDSDNLSKVVTLLSRGKSFQGLRCILLTHNGYFPESLTPVPQQVLVETIAYGVQSPPVPPLDEAGFEPPLVHEPAQIDLVDLGFTYRTGNTVFRNLNLRLEPGRIYRLAGPNGSGKSTLARLLTGVLRPTQGGLRVNGRKFDSYSRPGALAHLHFQSADSQLFESTVGAELKSLDADSKRAATRFAGLGAFLDQHPFDLPFVLRKRLALTVILHSSAPWLIFDEPVIGQDENSRSAIGKSLRKLAAAGHGVILISHNAEFARSFSDEELNLLNLECGRSANSQSLQLEILPENVATNP